MFQGFRNQIRDSHFGRGAEAGFAESFGFQRDVHWEGNQRSYKRGGFLGRDMKQGGKESARAFAGRKSIARIGGVASLAYIGYSAYTGYQEGGVWGATKGVAESVAINSISTGLFNAAVGAVGSVPLAIGAAAVGGAYGYYRLGEAGQTYAKNLRKLEMGSETVDTFGTAASMRQRSLSAIQNSHVNGRMALGNEAGLMHMSYRR